MTGSSQSSDPSPPLEKLIPTQPDWLQFEDEAHEYLVYGERFPSVTEVIGDSFVGPDYSGIPAHVLNAAAERGNAVHAAAPLILDGSIDWESIDPRIHGQVESLAYHFDAVGAEMWASEIRLASLIYMYAGTADFWGLIEGYPSILDVKSGLVGAVDMQTSGYKIALIETLVTQFGANIDKRILKPKRYYLHVPKDGFGEIKELPDTESDDADFLAALRMFRRRRRDT